MKEPTIDPIHEGDTTITGSVTLDQPIPADTTFEATVTLPDGSTISVPVNADGTFTVDLGGKTLSEGDTVSTVVEGTHTGETKESAPVTTIVLAKSDGSNGGNTGSNVKATSSYDKAYNESDEFPQTGETQNSVFSLLGILAIGLAGLFLFSKNNRKITK